VFNRIIMGYDLWIWWMRSLSFLIISPFLGPHLVSIGKMVEKERNVYNFMSFSSWKISRFLRYLSRLSWQLMVLHHEQWLSMERLISVFEMYSRMFSIRFTIYSTQIYPASWVMSTVSLEFWRRSSFFYH